MFRRKSDLRLDWHLGLLACRLKKELIVGAVIHMENEQRTF
jgi:hypothetical protein